jgi:hypothetical protein
VTSFSWSGELLSNVFSPLSDNLHKRKKKKKRPGQTYLRTNVSLTITRHQLSEFEKRIPGKVGMSVVI